MKAYRAILYELMLKMLLTSASKLAKAVGWMRHSVRGEMRGGMERGSVCMEGGRGTLDKVSRQKREVVGEGKTVWISGVKAREEVVVPLLRRLSNGYRALSQAPQQPQAPLHH